MQKSTTAIIVSCAILASILIPSGCIWGLTFASRVRAQNLFRRIAALQLGKSTFQDAQQIANDYGAKTSASVSGDGTCTAEKCEFLFSVKNQPLSFVPGIRSVSFGEDISVERGRVSGLMVALSTHGSPGPDGQPAPEYLYGVVDSATRNDKEYGPEQDQFDEKGVPHMALFRLGPRSSAEDRARAYSIDLSCLSRVLGCDNPSNFYPSGWQSWPHKVFIDIE